MRHGRLKAAVGGIALLVVAGTACRARAQVLQTRYPRMAPVAEYMMARDAEIALARSAAPDSISRHAGVMVLGRHGYETAVRGDNGFVCLVERSWTAGIDDPDFWNPRLRAPICLNASAVRSYLPLTLRKTVLVLSGRTKRQMFAAVEAAIARKEVPAPEPGAMCYMMSRQGYLSDAAGRWHPHLMFFVPLTDPRTWGAGVPGSPVLAATDAQDRLTVFLVPVARWSDGTLDSTVVR